MLARSRKVGLTTVEIHGVAIAPPRLAGAHHATRSIQARTSVFQLESVVVPDGHVRDRRAELVAGAAVAWVDDGVDLAAIVVGAVTVAESR